MKPESRNSEVRKDGHCRQRLIEARFRDDQLEHDKINTNFPLQRRAETRFHGKGE
jgi:hypothetical protein